MQLFSKDAFSFREQLRNVRNVQNLCLSGLFVASYVALSFFSIKITEVLEVRFAFLALVAAAAYGGPVMGMAAGLIGDVVSFFIIPQSGPFSPGFTVSYALLGFLFGILLYRSRMTPLRAFAAGLADFLVSCTLNTLWLHFVYGMDLEYLFTIRLIKNVISLGVNTVLIFIFMKAFSRIILIIAPRPKASRP